MGHQISFFLSPNDTLEIERELLSIGEGVILHSRSRGPYPRIIDSTDLIEDGHQWLFFCFARSVDLDFLVNEEIRTQGYWSINTIKSPVIEFTRSFFDGRVLKTGRLYCDNFYYDESTNLVRRKSQDFSDWAKRILSKAKRLLTYDKEFHAYLGDEAIELHKVGIELQHI